MKQFRMIDEYEVSRKGAGADDWVATNIHGDTVEGAKSNRQREHYPLNEDEFEYRMVKKTLTTELVEMEGE